MLDHNGWDNIVNRMLNSRAMSEYLFLGVSADYGFPVIAPRKRARPHVWVMGMPGAGTIVRYGAPITTQAIAGGDRSLLVIDFEPNKALLWNTVIESERAGRPCRVFDPTPGRPSCGFNVFRQSHLGRQSLNQKIETLLQAFDPQYGIGHGHSWFSAASEAVGSDIAAKYDCDSFDEIARLLLDPAAFRFIDAQLWQASAQYRIAIARVAAVPPANVSEKTPGITPEVLAHSIDMRQLFHQPQAAYFVLNSTESRTTSCALGGLAASHLFAAAAREEDKKCEVDLVINGAQELVGPGLGAVLGQAAMGVDVTLIHDHLGQLRRSDQDYAETLECMTGLQVVFAPTGQRIRKWIMDTAGTITRPSVRWSQSLAGVESTDDDFRLRYADAARDDQLPRATVAEQEVRAITENDLIRWSADPRIALVRLVSDEGLARYGGAWIPTLMSFHIDEGDYEDRRDGPWPEGGPGTIGVPLESDYDRRFKDGPRPSVATQQLQDKIRKLRGRKEGEK